MNYTDLKNLARSLYLPALLLEDSISHKYLRGLEQSLRILTVLGVASSAVVYGSEHFLHDMSFITLAPKAYGALSLIFCLWLAVFLLQAFYYSHVYKDSRGIKEPH